MHRVFIDPLLKVKWHKGVFHFLVRLISVANLDNPFSKHVFFEMSQDVCITLENVRFGSSVLATLI
jgi:hypothetical protein